MSLAQLLAERPCVLLDFDGPVCAVFGGTMSAPDAAVYLTRTLRDRGIELHAEAAATGDPFNVLRAAAPGDTQAVEEALRNMEVRAVASAPATTGLREMLSALRATGHAITIVSNNSGAAVRAFVRAHYLDEYVDDVVGRVATDPALLKPHPHLVHQAIDANGVPPGSCVLIGDSTTDIIAAHEAGTAVIGYANKPGKRRAFALHRPDAIIDDLHEITDAATSIPAR